MSMNGSELINGGTSKRWTTSQQQKEQTTDPCDSKG